MSARTAEENAILLEGYRYAANDAVQLVETYESLKGLDLTVLKNCIKTNLDYATRAYGPKVPT